MWTSYYSICLTDLLLTLELIVEKNWGIHRFCIRVYIKANERTC